MRVGTQPKVPINLVAIRSACVRALGGHLKGVSNSTANSVVSTATGHTSRVTYHSLVLYETSAI